MACNIVTKSGFALASKCFYGFASSRPSNAESYDETILSLLCYALGVIHRINRQEGHMVDQFKNIERISWFDSLFESIIVMLTQL